MTRQAAVLVTGAGGDVGAVSPLIVKMMIHKGYPVRAFVRRDDERADSLRRVGAQVFVGDLLDVADVAAALAGCRRVYFSMSLSPYYSDAVTLMAAAARAQGDIEVFVNMSEYEQAFMTFGLMAAPLAQRRQVLSANVTQWSPQQRAHWVAEQVLDWSGLPVVNIRATIFVENPLLSRFPLPSIMDDGELRLPYGTKRVAPIAGYDVGAVCANILADPTDHICRSYALTGAHAIDMYQLAEDYAAVLGRPVSYIPQDADDWIEKHIRSALYAINPHAADHLITLVQMVADGFYEKATGELEALLGRPARTVRWALSTLIGQPTRELQ
ncbi:NmrA family NAD(P)-binding protein [Mycobacterium sp. 050134]|uniref:NmrA family NAD(P)-binding protein n=1 Tax=Mycobacterium sp. 050134 TaxID=3096111 RepID=UPI002EDA690C